MHPRSLKWSMRAQSQAPISTPQVLHSARLRDMATPSSCQSASSGVDVVLAMALATGDNVACRPLCVADGVDECRKAVRLMIRRGAKVIKVLASGGVLSRDDDPKFQQFSDEELKVIVEEAARMNRVVAAHVHGKAGIMAAIKAGCKTLEHGTYLDEEAVKLMLEKDVMLVATRLIVIEGVKLKDSLSPESYKKMLETAKYHKKAYGLAIKKGVKCALGTDLGISVPGTGLSHGSAGAELLYAVEAGMTPLQAIEAATANGPATLGPMAPLSGQIKVGITLGHPSGTLLVAAKFEAEGSVSEATVFRTARRIMEGQVFWKASQ